MKKLLIDIVYCIAILGFVGGGCYNILSVRPDIVAELPACIQMTYLLAESIIEKSELEVDVEAKEDICEKTQPEDDSEVAHIHDWKTEEVATWQSNGDGTGRVVFVEIHRCDCGAVMKK